MIDVFDRWVHKLKRAKKVYKGNLAKSDQTRQ